jgi:predicted GIY-YIG superfamily endonuclease
MLFVHARLFLYFELMKYHSYVLRSLKNDILYKGYTKDIEKRLLTHHV